jgi:hypothetical protein
MRKDEQGHAVPDGPEAIVIRDVRCACAVCGVHVVAWQGHGLSGWCPNCGSYDVRALPELGDGGRLGNELLLGKQPVLHREQARGRAAGGVDLRVDVLDVVAGGLW